MAPSCTMSLDGLCCVRRRRGPVRCTRSRATPIRRFVPIEPKAGHRLAHIVGINEREASEGQPRFDHPWSGNETASLVPPAVNHNPDDCVGGVAAGCAPGARVVEPVVPVAKRPQAIAGALEANDFFLMRHDGSSQPRGRSPSSSAHSRWALQSRERMAATAPPLWRFSLQ